MKRFCYLIAFLATLFWSPDWKAQEAEDTVVANYTYTVLSRGAPPIADGDYLFSNQLSYISFWCDLFGPATKIPGLVYDDEMALVIVRTFQDGSESIRLKQIIETKNNVYVVLKKSYALYFNEAVRRWGMIENSRKQQNPFQSSMKWFINKTPTDPFRN